jgi:hypothetical protein
MRLILRGVTDMKDTYRGNKTITVGELKAFLNDFSDEAEIVFNVDVDPSSSFYHADSLETDLKGDAWINLTPR